MSVACWNVKRIIQPVWHINEPWVSLLRESLDIVFVSLYNLYLPGAIFGIKWRGPSCISKQFYPRFIIGIGAIEAFTWKWAPFSLCRIRTGGLFGLRDKRRCPFSLNQLDYFKVKHLFQFHFSLIHWLSARPVMIRNIFTVYLGVKA